MQLKAEACQQALIELEDTPAPNAKSYRAMHSQYFSEKRKQFYTRYQGIYREGGCANLRAGTRLSGKVLDRV